VKIVGGGSMTSSDRPARPTERLEILAVDDAGRPLRGMRQDLVTGERVEVEFVGGYRQPAGAIHVYEPLDGLKEAEGKWKRQCATNI
jgi:hypothetical protein